MALLLLTSKYAKKTIEVSIRAYTPFPKRIIEINI